MSNPLVLISFDFPEGEVQVHHEIHANGSLPFNPNDIHPTAATSNTSFEYSGRHDQGLLPQLQATGHMAHLITAILDAKTQSDNFLTAKIGQQMGGIELKAGDIGAMGEEEENGFEADVIGTTDHAKAEPAVKKQKTSKQSKSR